MKIRKLLKSNQRGFTLIELLVAIAISGLIAGGITMIIFQVFDGNARTSNHMMAVSQVQNAGYWVSHDGQQAQNVEPEDPPDPDGFPFVLTWAEWDGTVNEVTYTIVGNDLQRSYSIGGGVPNQATVARHITSIEVVPRPFNGGKFTFTVTASVGTGSQVQNETRIYEVTPRPGV